MPEKSTGVSGGEESEDDWTDDNKSRAPVLTPIMNNSWFGKPVEEVDPFVVDDTFCVISRKYRRHYIYRFSCSKSLFLMGPLNPIRKFCIYITTHQWFDILIVLTILANCVTLAMIRNEYDMTTGERIYPGYDYYIDRIEYGFLGIYTLELILKVVAKGLVLNRYSYLRNRWNILDLIVVASGYTTLIEDIKKFSRQGEDFDAEDNDLDFLRTFRVLRAVKTISILPGLRVMINALLNSVVHLVEVMVLTLVCLIIFAVFALEVFQGKLKQKCVIDMEEGGGGGENSEGVDRTWTLWVRNKTNWKERDFPVKEPTQCGNDSDTRQCGDGYTCISHLGDNPDDGWTSFDHFFMALLSSFQLLTLDYWERLYDLVVSTCGFWSLFWFILVIFFGAYYLLNLMLAVVAMSYENEAQLQDRGPTNASQRLAVNRRQSNFSFEDLTQIHINKMTYYRKRTRSERVLIAKRLKLTSEEEGNGGETMHLDDAILSLLGMRLNLDEGHEEYPDAIPGVQIGPVFVEGPKRKPRGKTDIHKDENEVKGSAGKAKPAEAEVDWIQDERLLWTEKIAMKFRTYLQPIVENYWFEMFITICIMTNTVVLAMEHHGASKELQDGLRLGNHIFMGIFTAEMVLKLLALQRKYFKSGWNIFDMFIVLISYLDLAIAGVVGEASGGNETGSRGLSVLRSMRLLRVFKLAQSWITMKILLNTIFSSFGALGNLICVLFIIIYIFAVMGMQTVGEHYTPAAFDAQKNPQNFPKWHWKHFWYAFMMVFRVLCGEWVEPLWECLRAQTNYLKHNNMTGTSETYTQYSKCFCIYLPILIVGNFIVLNLFLALLLNSFDTEELNAQRERELGDGKTDIKTIVGFLMNKEENDGSYDSASDDSVRVASTSSKVAEVQKTNSAGRRFSTAKHPVEHPAIIKFRKMTKILIMHNRKVRAEWIIKRMENRRTRRRMKYAGLFFRNPAGGEFDVHYFHRDVEDSDDSEQLTVAGDCFPSKLWTKTFCPGRGKRKGRKKRKRSRFEIRAWNQSRQMCVAIVGHPAFEWIILVLIIASSICLCFEDVELDSKPDLKRTLCILNMVFTGIFTVEMILKWMAIGLWGYFTSFWTILDAFIVAVGLVTTYFDIKLNACSYDAEVSWTVNLGALKALRTLRALRPLRAISRWQGMKMVVNALIYSIPSIFNVLLVCLLFWLIFSIMGVQFFKGQFYRCVDELGERIDPKLVPNRDVCCAKADTHGFSWVNTISNYDNVLEGYLSLLQIATFEGWMELMSYSVDATGVDKQPVMDYQIEYYAFYVVFIVFGSFFTLQLFIGVIIDNFNMLKKKYDGNVLEILLTPAQRSYYIAMKNLGRRGPTPVVPKPKCKIFMVFYHITMSRQLEIFIFCMIFLNLIFEAIETFSQTQKTTHIVRGFNSFFTIVYIIEAVIKILALGLYYFTVPWNVYDFSLCVASCLDMFFGDLSLSLPIPPTMLRVVRVVRIGRIFRLIKAAQGLRKLLFALVVSIPALFNIGMLLGLITFIYSILGMALFGRAPRKWSIDSMYNFETFVGSNLMLLRLMTAAGWNEVLDSLTVVKPVCGYFRHLECGLEGEPECPYRSLVVGYIVSYLVLTYLIVINLYIAIILENYAEATNEENVGIVEDDLEMFYSHWARYDPYATQFINFSDLSDFLDNLDPPLQIAKPNTVAIVSFNIPIARGNKVHCLDLLRCLVNYVLGEVEESKEFRKLQNQIERKFQKQFPTRRLLDIVYSSRRWKIEDKAATTIQRAWKEHWKRTHPNQGMDSESLHSGKSSKRGGPTHGGLGHMMVGNVEKQKSKRALKKKHKKDREN